MDSNTSPWKINRPCSANWEEMRGDDKRRFCDHCQKYVHNVSAMNRAERETYASPDKMHECVFYCQRPDGRIVDLSILAAVRRWFPFLRLAYWSALLALLPATLTGCKMGQRCTPVEPAPRTEPANPASTTSPTTPTQHL